jgi:hypothetical protein
MAVGGARRGGSARALITGTDTYEWLPGGFFIVHRWRRHRPGGSARLRRRDRCRAVTLTVSADGQRMSARWERSDVGSVWERWMDMTFTRLP